MYRTVSHNSDSVISLLSAGVLTDVVGRSPAPVVVPEVVPEDGEQGVVVLPHHHAVLAVEVVRLALGPVKPAHTLIVVRPPPLSRTGLTVTLLSKTC